MMKRALLFSLSLAFTCSSIAAGLPQLFGSSAPGFTDAELIARKVEGTRDGGTAVTAAARAGQEEVSLRVVVPARWEPTTIPGLRTPAFRGTITIDGVGKPTEALVRALATAYQQKLDKYDFDRVTLTAIALEGDPSNIRSVPVKLKLTYESPKEDERAEVFLDVDLRRGVVQLREKDPDYRKAVIKFLSKKSSSS